MRQKTAYSAVRHQKGLSLVELGVALAVVGIIGIIAWRWVASTRMPMERSAIISQLAQAQVAVEGFVLANGRLPCAATGSDGMEQCGNHGVSAVLLPWRTLGLGSRFGQLHYGANRGGGLDLASLPSASVAPDLGLDFSPAIPVLARTDIAAVNAAAAAVTDAISAATSRRATVNGLDWCRVARQFAANPAAPGVLTAGHSSDSLPVAFVVAHPGANGMFEGNNVPGAAGGWRFDLPGRSQSNAYDDLAVAVGAADLSARIGCVARLGAMQSAAQGAYAAYDNARAVQEYWSLRVFDIEQAQSALEGAETGVILAAMNLALATGSAALAVASAANTEAITVFGVALSIANAASAGVEVGLAAIDLTEAQDALQASMAKEVATQAYVMHIYETFTQALNASVLLDEKGLNP